MVIETTVKKVNVGSKVNSAPVTAKWKGVPYIRSQSFLATIREIINFSAEIDVCRIGLIGSMHSGKSTLSQSIAHAIHKHADIPYSIKILYKDELTIF
jgi:ABC-type polysaccharide/polyol phosphate transport system ATPase subunit